MNASPRMQFVCKITQDYRICFKCKCSLLPFKSKIHPNKKEEDLSPVMLPHKIT